MTAVGSRKSNLARNRYVGTPKSRDSFFFPRVPCGLRGADGQQNTGSFGIFFCSYASSTSFGTMGKRMAITPL